MIPVEQLQTIPLFAELHEQELARLAPLFHHTRRKHGDVLCQPDELGAAFYVLEGGTLRIRQGAGAYAGQVLGYLNAPAFVGQDFLPTGLAPDAIVDVDSPEADLMVLFEREFDDLLARYPGIRERLALPVDIKGRELGLDCSWLAEGELVLASTRRHWYALIVRLWWPAALALFLVAVALALLLLDPAAALPGLGAAAVTRIVVALLAIALLGTLGAGAWNLLDWTNDYYFVTNKRVIHFEKVVLFFEEREEAPIDQVTNVVELTQGLAPRLLGFSDLRVETAGREVEINFTYAPRSARIAQHIFEQMGRVRERAACERRERVRAGIRQHLWQRLAPEAAAAAAAAPAPAAPLTAQPERRRRSTGLGQVLRSAFALRIDEPHQVTWHKHWFVLFGRLDEPLMALILLVIVGAIHASGTVPIRVFGPAVDSPLAKLLLAAVWLILVTATLFWAWYQYEDWNNDLYRVTDDRVIDVERSPFGLWERSVETTLDRVQDISYVRQGPIAVLFNYGDIAIETAGAGRFVFYHIENPRAAAQEIFRRRDVHRSGRQRAEADQQRSEFMDWIAEYHRFQQEQGGGDPGIAPPAPNAFPASESPPDAP